MSSSKFKDVDKEASKKSKVPKRPEIQNGGSLEDCFSNVYQLLELPGIKWKCFRTRPSAPRDVPLTTDLVIRAYSKCILNGILCAWRRKPLPATGNGEILPLPRFSNDTPRELWVFWYDENEPVVLKQYCEGLEVDEEVSSANQGNIVSYDVRTILFKALHIFLERDLMRDGYIRFGKWFTVPTEAREHYQHCMYPTYTPALRMNFFVHGGNAVCISIQGQKQPTLLNLHKRHLEYKRPQDAKGLAVIVGPWSMRGNLVRDQIPLLEDPKMQEAMEKEWNYWKDYLQMEVKEPEKVPDTERLKSPEPEPAPAPHRSLLTDSSDEEAPPTVEDPDEKTFETAPPHLKWMYLDWRIEKPKDLTPEEKENREKARKVRKERREKRKEREERRKEAEKKRADAMVPGEYDSDVLTDPEAEKDEATVHEDVPKMVLLDIDGVRMLYPSKFICVTLEDDRVVLESMGLKTHPMPEELQAHPRRPRNRFVVGVANPIIPLHAVYQYCQLDRNPFKLGKKVERKEEHGFEKGLTKVPISNLLWRSLRPFGLCKCEFIPSKKPDIKIRLVCEACNLSGYRRAKYDGRISDSSMACVSPKKQGNSINFGHFEEVRNMVINRVKRKNDFAAYHKKAPVKVVKWRDNRKPRRSVVALEDLEAREREQKEQDEDRASESCRVDTEEDAYQVDKLCQEDWLNFDEEDSRGIPEIDSDKQVFNEVQLERPPPDDDYNPTPFLPITFFAKKPINGDFEMKPGDEDMSEERFNELYHDNGGKWTAEMTRSEKIEVASYEFDPMNRPVASPRPYHLTEMPKRSKWVASLPMPIDNKYYNGPLCEKGLKSLGEIIKEKDVKHAEEQAKRIAKYRRNKMHRSIKTARQNRKKLKKILRIRSVDKAVRQLKKILKKDHRSKGTKQTKFSALTPKRKEEVKRRREEIQRRKLGLRPQRKPGIEEALAELNMNAFCSKYERSGRFGEGETDGYIVPNYAETVKSPSDEDSDLEEQKNGLGEGTSGQSHAEDSVVKNEEAADHVVEMITIVGQARTAAEHVGPDGLLSPPASNEMPKGGPLSVGPPSIEAQGLNQIYPTPPSVQMLQGESVQAHSPLMHAKLTKLAPVPEENVERIAVPGGVAKIIEIKPDDPETENMQKWNKKTAQSKLSKFLVASSEDPILAGRKKKYATPVSAKFTAEKLPKKVTSKMVYKSMLTTKFDCAPNHAFGEMVRARIHEKRMAAIAIAAATTAATAIPPSVHQSPMLPNPMFASPALPPHTPSPSLGPMALHPMGPPAYPPTPGQFNAPATPTYPGMASRPGSNFGPGHGYPHQMMPPGYPMGQRMGPPQQMMSQQQHMQMIMQQQRIQQQMMHNRQMAGQGMPPGFGYPPGSATPGPFAHHGPSGMQQLNNFVNQPRFGPNGGQPPPYGMPQSMIPQSPNFNQPFGMNSGSQMMSPAHQQQFHQQQMQIQQMQMQRNQMQQQQMQMQQMHQQQQQQLPQPPMKPTKHQIQMERQEVWLKVVEKMKLESPRQYENFQLRQQQLAAGVMPTSLQPVCLRTLRQPPDANIPFKNQLIKPLPPPEVNVPEGDSLTLAIILSDTILDLHFDSVFDSCPICSCSVSIRSRDLGMYIAPHEFLRTNRPGLTGYREYSTGIWSGFHVSSVTSCTCGFSSIRHRYLSCCSGLFPEDANEATAQNQCVAKVIPDLQLPRRVQMTWFDSKSAHDLALLDQIRHLSFSNSLGKAVSHMAAVGEHAYNLQYAADMGTDISIPSEYLISHVDVTELLLLGNSAIDMSLKSGIRKPSVPESHQTFLSYFHPWGLQTANEITELDVVEYIDLLSSLTPTLEMTAKLARQIPPETSFQIEGPMTWKQIVFKSLRGRPPSDDDEDFSLAEPIPAVMRATETEAIRAAPHIEQYYDQASLGPVDQPKDVMYITIIPDDDDIYRKTVNFMETVTKTYENMRLGRHIPFPVSTGAANHFREIMKNQRENPYSFVNPDAYPGQQQFPPTLAQLLRNHPPKKADKPKPVKKNPKYWEKKTANKVRRHEHLEKGPNDDLPIHETSDTFEIPRSYYEREGILRVGTPLAEITSNLNQLVTNTAEFMNMTRHLSDEEGYVSRLRMYMQQMEDLVTSSLTENRQAFERSGYRYQLAVEGRLKRKEKRKKVVEERMRYNAAKAEDDKGADTAKPPEESDLPLGVELGNSMAEDWVDDEEEEKRLKKIKEDEMYPIEEPQAPSPIPAGMVNIPETLSIQERATQQTLEELLSEPCNVTPHNAASISWTQRDTSVPNPFPTSNQMPVPFEAIGSNETDAVATLPHVIVIYIVNPFSYGAEGQSALHMRIALLSIIRTYNSIMSKLTPLLRSQVQLEIIGMESLEEAAKPMPDYFNDPKVPFDLIHDRQSRRERNSETAQVQIARSLSVAVYTHPRVFLPDVYKSVSARCMTAFGPGTQLLNTINEINERNAQAIVHSQHRSKAVLNHMAAVESYGVFTPPLPPPLPLEQTEIISLRIPSNIVTLAPPPPVCQMEENGKTHLNPTDEQTLFIAYCLVGTDFLVATATDAQGKLIDNCVANIKPKRKHNETYRYKHNKTQILDGMGKLWSFILGIMASDIKNWRLVVGRLGRIGHGEFRAWTHLLNKTSLLRYSSSLKEICGACRSMPSLIGTPAILSACLISLEPEPSIRVFPDYFDQEASTKKNSIFMTPGDLSCTHILTFPVGAEINLEVQDQSGDQKAEENWEFGDLDIMEGLDDGDTEIMKDVGLETLNSTAIRNPCGSWSHFNEDSSNIEIQNQPLAAGYYISTAAAPELPNWFWASCPSAKRHSPVHLKSSLHINITEVKNDDIAMESTKDKEKEKDKEEKDSHPLESRQTEEVLRHVLESYNALSWLNMNRQTGERYSCLPIHIQHLLRLYHSVARLLV